MGMHSYPDEIFLITSNWYSDLDEQNTSDTSQFWTCEKQSLWRSAYEETTNWLEEENRSRNAQGVAPSCGYKHRRTNLKTASQH